MDFAVDTEGLAALGNNLRRCGDNLESALDALNVELGTLGSGILDQACATFQDNWQTGLEKIREFTDKLAEGVELSAKQYAEVDKALRQAFTQMQGALETPQQGQAGEVSGGGYGQ